MSTTEDPGTETAIPDLTATSLDNLAEDGGTVLAEAVRLYRPRLREGGVPLSSFNARI